MSDDEDVLVLWWWLQNKKKNQRYWIHPLISDRQHNSYVVLLKGGKQLKGFYTVNKSYFDHLLPVVALQITKNGINSRRAVGAEERLIIMLRRRVMSYEEEVLKGDELSKEDCILEPEVIVTVKEEVKDGEDGGNSVIGTPCDNASSSDENFEFVVVKNEPEDSVSGGEEDDVNVEITERNAFGNSAQGLLFQGERSKHKNEKFKSAQGHSVTRRMVGAAEIRGGSQQTVSVTVREPLAGPSTSGADKIVPVSSHSDIKTVGMHKSSSIGLQRTVGKFICKHCGNIFETFVEFELHVKTHFSEKPFTCPCGRSYMHKGHLKEHMLTHTDRKPHVCTQCGKSFAHKGDLTIHTRIHTGEKPYSCTECGKSFVQGGQLKMHMRTHTGEKPYSCSVCGKSFVQKHNMLDHMFLHTGEKPYSCTLCGRSFVQGCHLKDHMKTHSGEKPHSCSFCGKSFLQNSDLRVHLRGHTGEKPFSCTECGKNFARSGVLKRHMLTHTGEKPYKCSLCGKEYTQSSKLKRHMMIQHNKKEITPETPKVILLPSLCSREGLQKDSNAESSVSDKKDSNSKECILPH